MKYNIDERVVKDLADKIAKRTAEYTARDVKSAAARSMKSGGKNRRLKSYKHSKPGDPPLYHTGGIKKAIAFEETKEGYVVGPEARGTSKALKTLEKGGTGTFSTTVYSKEYEATLRRRARPAKGGKTRPATARKYFFTLSDGKTKSATQYRYFYSKDAWKRAVSSSRFLNWAKTAQWTEKKDVKIAPRPYMNPALKKETAPNRIQPRIKRVANQFKTTSNGRKKK